MTGIRGLKLHGEKTVWAGAALNVANVIEFTSALNRDKKVPVWISLPITFTTR